MKIFSTFTGIGGFELGIIQACKRLKLAVPIFVGYSEIDRYAIETYKKHFPNHINYGDITKIKEKELPDFDMFVGGFPCQAFSIAGKRKGFADTRGTLFFDIARILRTKQPRLVLLENVKGLLSHANGDTFKTIVATLDELGYDLQWQVLNSKDFGVPQNRERILIVGHLRETSRPEVFPITGNNEEAIFGTVKSTYHKGQTTGSYINETAEVGTIRSFKDKKGFRKMQSGISPAIRARAREDGDGQPVIRIRETGDGFHQYRNDEKRSSIQGTHVTYQSGKTHALSTAHKPMVLVREATKQGYVEATVGDSINLSVPNSATPRGRVGRGVAQTLDTGMQQHTLAPQGGVRRLTPIECERLQGFPDSWTAGVSDTQRYKMLGNAVTVNVIQAVCERLFL